MELKETQSYQGFKRISRNLVPN